jgi:hypothetical protein
VWVRSLGRKSGSTDGIAWSASRLTCLCEARTKGSGTDLCGHHMRKNLRLSTLFAEATMFSKCLSTILSTPDSRTTQWRSLISVGGQLLLRSVAAFSGGNCTGRSHVRALLLSAEKLLPFDSHLSTRRLWTSFHVAGIHPTDYASRSPSTTDHSSSPLASDGVATPLASENSSCSLQSLMASW